MKKISSHHHGKGILRISLLLLLLSPAVSSAAAQPPSPRNTNDDDYASMNLSLAIIVVVFVAALFFMGFFSIYIRYCSHSSAAARGLDASVLESFPILPYSDQIGKECAVCLTEFVEKETLRLIPKCDHVFHPECIDAWLHSHVTCPVCRTNLAPHTENEQSHVPQPVELSEIIVIERAMNRSSSPNYPNQPPSAGSIRRPKMFSKFRSHSTGHSLLQPGLNLERYTLRLPEGMKEEVMNRAALKRTGSLAETKEFTPRV